jgi:hypothetical protein
MDEYTEEVRCRDQLQGAPCARLACGLRALGMRSWAAWRGRTRSHVSAGARRGAAGCGAAEGALQSARSALAHARAATAGQGLPAGARARARPVVRALSLERRLEE